MNELRPFIERMERLELVVKGFPNQAARQAVAFSKERFRAQNWVDARTEPWKKRKENSRGRKLNRGRAILVKSGRMKRSVRKIRANEREAVVGTDVPYAPVHNEGLRAGRGRGFKMPKRQFLGNSQVLATQIERQLAATMIKAIR